MEKQVDVGEVVVRFRSQFWDLPLNFRCVDLLKAIKRRRPIQIVCVVVDSHGGQHLHCVGHLIGLYKNRLLLLVVL